ncbi:MAG: hypothetical protein GF315_03975 [candidate division Zixibacteria bacterium]|nr:hypothetical protein [candidate division Zixibacteria bacterium]
MELIYNAEILTTEISRSEDGYLLSIGDKNIAFKLSDLSPGVYSLIVDGKSKKVYVANDNESIYVNVDGDDFVFDIPRDDTELRSEATAAAGADDFQVLPPMPSKVVKIMVEVGQKVSVGEGLVVLESMKMENLVKSKVDAIVEAVNFVDGDLVDTGKVVIKLAPIE